MNDKLKFYRSTLVQIAKGLIGYTPMHKLAEDADKVAKEIMKKVDEYENSFNYQTQVNENSTITCNYPNFFKGVNPDYFKTEPIRTPEKEKDKNLKPFLDEYDSKHFELKFQEPMKTIVDNGPQYQPNQKSYGTLGEHWKELMELFYIKSNFEHWKKLFNDVIIPDLKLYGHVCPRTEFNIYYYKRVDDVYNSLGIEFIEDFVKACEKCEE